MEFDMESVYRMWTQGVQALGQDRFPPEVWAKEYSYFIQCMRSGAEPSVKLTSDLQILKEYGVVVPNQIKPAAKGGLHNFAQAQQPLKQQQVKQKPPNQKQQQQQQHQQQLQLQRELQQQQQQEQQHCQQLQQQRDLLIKLKEKREHEQQLIQQRQQQQTPEQKETEWQSTLLRQQQLDLMRQQQQIQSYNPLIKQKPHLQPMQLKKQPKYQQQQAYQQQQQQQQHSTNHQLPPKQPQLPVTKTQDAVKPNSEAIVSVAPRVADLVFVKPLAPKENMIIAPKATVTRKRKDSIFDQIEHDIGDTERFFAALPSLGTPIANVLTKPAVQSTGAASTSKAPQPAQNSEHRPSKHKKKKKH